MKISFDEAVYGCEKEIELEHYVKCDKCTPGENGTSIYPIIGYKKNTSESLVWKSLLIHIDIY